MSTSETTSLPVGFTWFDIDNRTDVRLHASTYNDSQGNPQLDLHTWGDTILYAAETNWLAVLNLNRDFQYGNFSSKYYSSYNPRLGGTFYLPFPKPYNASPSVLVWLNEFDITVAGSWRLNTHVSDISPEGFILSVDTWAGTLVNVVGVSWIAFLSNRSDMVSDAFTLDDLPPRTHLDSGSQKSILFNRTFPSVPRIAAAFSGFDMSGSANLTARLAITDVTTTGLTWHLDAKGGSILYGAWGSYIAVLQPPPPSSDAFHKSRRSAVIGGSIGGVISLALVIALFFLYHRRRRRQKQGQQSDAANVGHVSPDAPTVVNVSSLPYVTSPMGDNPPQTSETRHLNPIQPDPPAIIRSPREQRYSAGPLASSSSYPAVPMDTAENPFVAPYSAQPALAQAPVQRAVSKAGSTRTDLPPPYNEGI